TMIFVSQGCLALTGYKPSDLLGNKTVSYASLIRAEDQRPLWQQIQKALVEKRIFILNYRIRTCDGREKWIWEQGQGIFSPDGELLFREGFIADVTELQQAQEAIKLSNERLNRIARV